MGSLSTSNLIAYIYILYMQNKKQKSDKMIKKNKKINFELNLVSKWENFYILIYS